MSPTGKIALETTQDNAVAGVASYNVSTPFIIDLPHPGLVISAGWWHECAHIYCSNVYKCREEIHLACVQVKTEVTEYVSHRRIRRVFPEIETGVEVITEAYLLYRRILYQIQGTIDLHIHHGLST
ncbi:hypothetical protein D3C87_1704040 [compost metagenome]